MFAVKAIGSSFERHRKWPNPTRAGSPQGWSPNAMTAKDVGGRPYWQGLRRSNSVTATAVEHLRGRPHAIGEV
jgi:hypothetical protein